MKQSLVALINTYGRACVRDGNPAWQSDEGFLLNSTIDNIIRINIEMTAGLIAMRYKLDPDFQKMVDSSNEPYRAMHSGSDIADHIIDGSDEYVKLVDELEKLMSN